MGFRQQTGQAIGVFDSGVGGLTVLRALMEKLPNERMLYLGDTARLPYGTKSADVVIRYSLKNAQFLVEQGIKLLVVACNTASSVALPALSEALSVPVIGVIEPGAKAAIAKTRTGKIGVIGTQGTVASGAYQRALEAAKPNVSVLSRACPLFVPLAEEGWTMGDVPRLAAQKYLAELVQAEVDTLVLGCTHYPLLSQVISEVMGPSVSLVDSAEATAELVAQTLADNSQGRSSLEPGHRYFLTDIPGKFGEVSARFLGRTIATAEQVDLKFS